MRYSFSRLAMVGVVVLVALVVLFSIWDTTVTTAQTSTTTPVADTQVCTQILTNVEQHLSQDCSNMDRDHVCYGNNTIKVELGGANGQLSFAKPGDVVPLDTIKSLTAGPLNPDTGDWGVAVLKVQTNNLAETTAGQAATFILYGNTTPTSNGTTVATAPAPTPAPAAGWPGNVSRPSSVAQKPAPSPPPGATPAPHGAVTATG